MSTKIITQLKVRTKTHAEWAASDPVIPIGEAARSSDVNSHLLRKGDGKTKWSLLTDYDPDVTTAPHAASHMIGGRDPIKLADLGGASGQNTQFIIPATAGWYRIAKSRKENLTELISGIFTVTAVSGSGTTIAQFVANICYNSHPTLSQLSCSIINNDFAFTKVRITYVRNQYQNTAYLEIYNSISDRTTDTRVDLVGNPLVSWELFTTVTPAPADLPTGYVSKEITLQPGVSISDLAEALRTPRNITLSQGATSTPISFDGSKNVEIPVTELDSSSLKYVNDPYSCVRYYDCAFFSTGPQTGAIKIALPNITNDVRITLDMDITEHATTRSAKAQFRGTFRSTSATVAGGTFICSGFSYAMKVGYETDHYNIYIGTNTQLWSSPNILISKITLYGEGRHSFDPKGLTFSIVDDYTTGITNATNLTANNTLVSTQARTLLTTRQFSITGEVNAPAVNFNGGANVQLQGYLNLLYSATRDYTTPTIVIGSNNNAYLWVKENGPGTSDGVKNPVTAGNTAYWLKIGGALAINRTQSAANERTAVIAKNTNYTVPAYTVGKNNLSVYIGGLKGLSGTDATKHLYKEIGSAGATSTTIQFLDDIPKEHDLIFEVINVS